MCCIIEFITAQCNSLPGADDVTVSPGRVQASVVITVIMPAIKQRQIDHERKVAVRERVKNKQFWSMCLSA